MTTPTLHGRQKDELQKRIDHAIYGVLEENCKWKKAGFAGVAPGMFFAGEGLVSLTEKISNAILAETRALIEEGIENDQNRPPY